MKDREKTAKRGVNELIWQYQNFAISFLPPYGPHKSV
jgi:hypothetical protein